MTDFESKIKKIYEKLPSMAQLAGVPEGEPTSHPLHGSSTGSNFKVDGNQWHCFREGHDSGGSKFEWIALEEGIINCEDAGSGCLSGSEFMDVVEIAADRVGLDINIEPSDRKEYREKGRRLQELYSFYEYVSEYYHNELMKDEEMKKWVIEKYGLNEETLKEFKIGFAPKNNELLDKISKKFGKGKALKSGLYIKTNDKLIPHFKGRVVFPYFRREKPRFFIARKTPKTPDNKYERAKYKKLLTHKEDKREYVTELVEEPIFGRDSIKGSKGVVITEGITDAISSIYNGFATVSPVTTRFKEEHAKDLGNLLESKEVYIAMDNEKNEAGLKGALTVLKELHKNSYLVELPRSDEEEKIDLNDYFREHSKEDFENLLENAKWKWDALCEYEGDMNTYFRASINKNQYNPDKMNGIWDRENNEWAKFFSIEEILEGCRNIKEAISRFRQDSRVKTGSKSGIGVDKKQKKRVVADALKYHIEDLGKFLKDQDNNIYFYRNKNKDVLQVTQKENGKPDKWMNFLNETYGINNQSTSDSFIAQELEEHGRQIAEEIVIHDLMYYDNKEGKLYISDRNKKYFELNGEEIKEHYNGENGIFFRDWYLDGKIDYVPKEEREKRKEEIDIHGEIPLDFEGEHYAKDNTDLFKRVLVDRSNFVGKTALEPRHQRLQLLFHLYTIPFDSILKNRPIMAFTGDVGSGKTVSLVFIGKFFMSPDFSISKLPQKDDFLIMARHKPIYFLDDINNPPKWLNNALTTIATGSSDDRRKLYTTDEPSQSKLKPYLGITSNSPKFRRNDVVDRLLIFHCERFSDGFTTKPMLFEPLEKKEIYDLVWSDYLDNLNDILGKVNNDLEEFMSKKSSHRIADWANFSRAIADVLGVPKEERENVLERMNNERAMFALEKDPLRDALQKWEAKGFGLVEKELDDGTIKVMGKDNYLSSSELMELLSELSDEFKNSYKRSSSLGRRMENVFNELRQLYGLKKKYDPKSKHYKWYFPKKDNGHERMTYKEFVENQVKIIKDKGKISEEKLREKFDYEDKSFSDLWWELKNKDEIVVFDNDKLVKKDSKTLEKLKKKKEEKQEEEKEKEENYDYKNVKREIKSCSIEGMKLQIDQLTETVSKRGSVVKEVLNEMENRGKAEIYDNGQYKIIE